MDSTPSWLTRTCCTVLDPVFFPQLQLFAGLAVICIDWGGGGSLVVTWELNVCDGPSVRKQPSWCMELKWHIAALPSANNDCRTNGRRCWLFTCKCVDTGQQAFKKNYYSQCLCLLATLGLVGSHLAGRLRYFYVGDVYSTNFFLCTSKFVKRFFRAIRCMQLLMF